MKDEKVMVGLHGLHDELGKSDEGLMTAGLASMPVIAIGEGRSQVVGVEIAAA